MIRHLAQPEGREDKMLSGRVVTRRSMQERVSGGQRLVLPDPFACLYMPEEIRVINISQEKKEGCDKDERYKDDYQDFMAMFTHFTS